MTSADLQIGDVLEIVSDDSPARLKLRQRIERHGQTSIIEPTYR